MTERASVFVDGGNFHHLVLKKLRIPESAFDFDGFAAFLANGHTLASKGFYTGTVREREGEPRTREAMAKQTAFLTILSKGGWALSTSKLRRRLETIPIDDRVTDHERLRSLGITNVSYLRDREKGIDVKIATDLVLGALDNAYDTAILVSSDADLVPAVEAVRTRFKKRVEYVGFSLPDKARPDSGTRPLLTLMKNTDAQRVLIASDFATFVRSDAKEAA